MPVPLSYLGSGDGGKPRGGTFALAHGGLVSAPLPWNADAQAVSDALFALLPLPATSSTTARPCSVSRQAVGHGYQWKVTFNGLTGDVALLRTHHDLIHGDDPRMTVEEVVTGEGALEPGSATHEVQVVATRYTQREGRGARGKRGETRDQR